MVKNRSAQVGNCEIGIKFTLKYELAKIIGVLPFKKGVIIVFFKLCGEKKINLNEMKNFLTRMYFLVPFQPKLPISG